MRWASPCAAAAAAALAFGECNAHGDLSLYRSSFRQRLWDVPFPVSGCGQRVDVQGWAGGAAARWQQGTGWARAGHGQDTGWARAGHEQDTGRAGHGRAWVPRVPPPAASAALEKELGIQTAKVTVERLALGL